MHHLSAERLPATNEHAHLAATAILVAADLGHLKRACGHQPSQPRRRGFAELGFPRAMQGGVSGASMSGISSGQHGAESEQNMASDLCLRTNGLSSETVASTDRQSGFGSEVKPAVQIPLRCGARDMHATDKPRLSRMDQGTAALIRYSSAT